MNTSSRQHHLRLGIGTWALGGPAWKAGRPAGWGAVDEAEAVRGIHHALERGIRRFDTADSYSAGKAERILGAALAGSAVDTTVVSTKTGATTNSGIHPYRKKQLISACEQSLRRLRRDVIDIYYFHVPDFGPENALLDEAMETMDYLRARGHIRHIGLSSFSVRPLRTCIPILRPAEIQVPASVQDTRFTQPGSDIDRICTTCGVTRVFFGVLGQGLLTGTYPPDCDPFPPGDHRRESPLFSRKLRRRVQSSFTTLRSETGYCHREIIQLMVRAVLHAVPECIVLLGFRKVWQVDETIQPGLSRPLTKSEQVLIRRLFQSPAR